MKKFYYFKEFIAAGADLGTFLPLALGLIVINKVNPTSLFLAAGILYISAGIYFRIPIPVQPLKATSALAMALGAASSTITAVCFFTAFALAMVRFLNLDKTIARLFSRPIIRGIQLGLAFILIRTGLKLIFGPAIPTGFPASAQSLDIGQAFFLLFLPQFPLTLANSVYATSETAKVYFKDQAERVTPRALVTSLGIANLFSGLIGGLPLCHGSSGITAHYRFGGKSGVCSIFAGLIFILLAFTFKIGIGNLISFIPFWLLGLSLIYIGIRHGALIRDIIFVPQELSVTLIIALYSLIFGNLAVAFGIGIIINFLRMSILKIGQKATSSINLAGQ